MLCTVFLFVVAFFHVPNYPRYWCVSTDYEITNSTEDGGLIIRRLQFTNVCVTNSLKARFVPPKQFDRVGCLSAHKEGVWPALQEVMPYVLIFTVLSVLGVKNSC